MDGISPLFIRGEIVYKYVLLVIFVLEYYFVNTLTQKYFLMLAQHLWHFQLPDVQA